MIDKLVRVQYILPSVCRLRQKQDSSSQIGKNPCIMLGLEQANAS